MYKKIIWPMLLFASVSLIIVFIVGVVTSIQISRGSEKIEPSETELESTTHEIIQEMTPTGTPNILVVGDSIGFGFGDDPDQGIGRRYIALIDPEGTQEIKLTNLSVSGSKVAELATLLNNSENEDLIKEANLIIISIGGNDLNNLDSQDEMSLEIVYKETLAHYKENLRAIIARIRVLNPNAQLAIVGLYDPYNAGDRDKTNMLLEWNYETERIVASDLKMAYVSTYELFKYHLDEYLAFDNFHPSPAGYQVITEQLYRILKK